MNFEEADELLPIFKRTLISCLNNQKKRPQKSLEFKITKPCITLSVNPPLVLEEEKQTNTVTKLEVDISVFNINETNFTIFTHGW